MCFNHLKKQIKNKYCLSGFCDLIWLLNQYSVSQKHYNWCTPSFHNLFFQYDKVNHILHSRENMVRHKQTTQKLLLKWYTDTILGNDNHSHYSMFIFVLVTAHPNSKLHFVSDFPFYFTTV